MDKKITLLLLTVILSINCYSQTQKDTLKNNSLLPSEIRGIVLDSENQEPLPYTNIIVKHQNRGVISNEKGDYLLNLHNLQANDSIWFQYIGYASKKLTVNQLLKNSSVHLSADVFAMNEIYILKQDDDPKKIVKKVLENKEFNYGNMIHKNQIFTRTRYNTDISKFNIKFEKSNIEGIDKEMIRNFEKSIPKQSTSYTDFLSTIYVDKTDQDELEVKVDPIKVVSLKEEDIAELEKIEKLFDSLFKSTGEKEYWKIKSGLLGGKIDLPEDEASDSLNKDTYPLKYYNQSVKKKLSFSAFENKKKWEFLYKTSDYNYNISGFTSLNNEDAYIIDFTPKKGGLYEGRLFISVFSFALIRADYQYAPNKIGKDFNLLGVGFSETEFAGSIYFEKINDRYELKYFSTKYINEFSINRKFSLQKKQSKFLFDKNLNEIKARFNMVATNESYVEYMVVESEDISKSTFTNFEEKEKVKVIYVDQFDENLWKDYNIIEPTEQMKAYKKLK